VYALQQRVHQVERVRRSSVLALFANTMPRVASGRLLEDERLRKEP
jgi:hypothetical protein